MLILSYAYSASVVKLLFKKKFIFQLVTLKMWMEESIFEGAGNGIINHKEIRRRGIMTKRRHKHSRQSAYDLQEDLNNIKAALAEATYDVRGRAGEMLSDSVANMRERSADIKENVEDYVANKPYKALGIAMAAGLIMGFLMRK